MAIEFKLAADGLPPHGTKCVVLWWDGEEYIPDIATRHISETVDGWREHVSCARVTHWVEYDLLPKSP
jgi:hypothetical protein